MNIVQLQDMLRGIPDDRLQTEMQAPSGSVPQYLVLSEIVRRDKARSSAAEAPKTTVVEDMMNQAQMGGGLESLVGQAPMAPEESMQEAAPMYADGGFISPADAMGRAGVAGYPQPPQKQPFQLSSQTTPTGGSMFTPNTNPAPAPQTNFNLNQQPAMDNGIQQSANIPSFMQQQNEYSNGYANGGVIGLSAGGMPQDLAFFIKREADRLGIDPVDLATTISYETAGTFDPAKKGPTTKWGRHIGLIQMGEPQREQYGYDPNGDLSSQMRSVGDYLADRGVKPGMGLLDVYSTVNAGSPGLYNRSDEKAGGAPGTVLDKVRDQMSGHKEKAMNLLQMFSQNAGNMMPAAPMALTDSASARLGPNAAQAMAEASKNMSAPTTLLSGIRSLIPEQGKLSGLGSGLRDMGTAMAEGQQAPEAPAAQMKSADISGLDRLRTNPEEDLAKYAALRQQYITGAYADGGTIRMADGSPGKTMHEGMYLGTTAETPQSEDPRSVWQWMTGVDPSVAAAMAENEKIKKEAEDARILFETDPEYRARIYSEKGPMGGDAVSPPEAKEIAAKSQLSPGQMLIANQEKQQKMLQEYYDSLIQLEKDRMGESQGFGAFLKEVGRGMLSNTSALGPSIAAGASRAIGSREDSRTSALDRQRELEMAKKKASIEGIAALNDIRYKQIAGDSLSSREQAQYLIPQLMKMADDYKDTNPDLAEAYRKQATEMMRAMGINIDLPETPVEEAETEGGFWSILGMGN
jgi:hypothetical protein